jgi:hypothetical protein
MTMRANAGVVRGPESWNYIYRFLGFALAIEGTTIVGRMGSLRSSYRAPVSWWRAGGSCRGADQ